MKYPVFVINGFLDAGKSTFINDTLKNDGFANQGSTLLLVCEEGEVEFNDKELLKYNVKVASFSSQEDFTVDVLYDLVEKNKPGRIVMEANTMWDETSLRFPSNFEVSKVVSFIDFTTFPVYFNNMRQKFVDNLRFADLVVINRCDNVEQLASYQMSLKLINNNAQFVAMNSQGVVQEAFEEPLPYDINKEIIEINDVDYARWYIDTFDHKERYEGKIVSFNGLILKSRKLPKDSFIVGRYAMTCCAKDMQLYGHLCTSSLNEKLKSKSWIHIVAKVTYEYSKEYDEEEVNLIPVKIEKIAPIKDPVLNLR